MPRKTKRSSRKKKKQQKRTRQKLDNPKAILSLIGCRRCWICNELIRSSELFERHVFDKHRGMTISSYDKLYPRGSKAFNLSDAQMNANQLYRALVYRAMHGVWPDWFEGSKKIQLEEADSSVLRAFASVMLRFQLERLLPAMEYSLVGTRRMFDVEHAATADKTALEYKLHLADSVVAQVTGLMSRMADLITKAEGISRLASAPNSAAGAIGFVAAGVLERSDSSRGQKNLGNELVATVDGLAAKVSSFLSAGPESLPAPPSTFAKEAQVEVVEEPKPPEEKKS